jgi:hypothetical protein
MCAAQDKKLTGMLTATTPGCRPQTVGNSSAFKWSETTVKPSRRGGCRVALLPDILCKLIKIMYAKTSFYDVLYEVQKDLQDASPGTDIFFLNPVHKNFCLEIEVKVGEVNFDLVRYN